MKLVEDDSVPENVKCGLMMQWYTDAIPDDLEAAIDALGEFLAMNPGEKFLSDAEYASLIEEIRKYL